MVLVNSGFYGNYGHIARTKIAKLVYKYLDIISHAKNKIDHGLKPEIIKTYSENNKEMPK